MKDEARKLKLWQERCFCMDRPDSDALSPKTLKPDSRLKGAGLWLLWSLMATLPLSLDVVLFWRLTVPLQAAGLAGSAAGGGSGGVGSLVGARGGGVGAGGIGVTTGLLGM